MHLAEEYRHADKEEEKETVSLNHADMQIWQVGVEGKVMWRGWSICVDRVGGDLDGDVGG